MSSRTEYHLVGKVLLPFASCLACLAGMAFSSAPKKKKKKSASAKSQVPVLLHRWMPTNMPLHVGHPEQADTPQRFRVTLREFDDREPAALSLSCSGASGQTVASHQLFVSFFFLGCDVAMRYAQPG
ncbi:hypothetical protein F4779DRAFT_112742 [Xylariaceae sp. FL0662B]|nr:hypothetical protein F4779DRAFT_112742 [Xylariaceae sp. FL0662B]